MGGGIRQGERPHGNLNEKGAVSQRESAGSPDLHSMNALSSDSRRRSTGEIVDWELEERLGSETGDYPRFLVL